MSNTTTDGIRSLMRAAAGWTGTGVAVFSCGAALLASAGIASPSTTPTLFLFLVFMAITLAFETASHLIFLSKMDDMSVDFAQAIGDHSWKDHAKTLVFYIGISAALSWGLSDNLQRAFVEICWEQNSTTEGCLG